jgi:hypothetical protein
MCKINECRIDLINNKIIVTKKFLNAAGVLNSPEYKILQQARLENPGFTVELREIKKAEKKNTYRNLSFTNMEMYIHETCGEGSREMKDFNRVRELAKIQAGPYAYVKTWFLNRYKDVFEQEEETCEDVA